MKLRASFTERALLMMALLAFVWGLVGLFRPALMPRGFNAPDAGLIAILLAQTYIHGGYNAIVDRANFSLAFGLGACAQFFSQRPERVMSVFWATASLIAAYGSFSMYRRLRKLHRQALQWTITEGKITRFTTSSYGRTVPLVDYAYQVNGRTYNGSAKGLYIADDRINKVGDAIDSLPIVNVRYDPAHSMRSRILNEDNPGIPFRIDHFPTS